MASKLKRTLMVLTLFVAGAALGFGPAAVKMPPQKTGPTRVQISYPGRAGIGVCYPPQTPIPGFPP